MHYKHLLDVTSRFTSAGAYETAMKNLDWHSLNFDIVKNVNIFEDFLGAWDSLRGGPLDKMKMTSVWIKDIEPYAMALERELLESLDVEKVIEAGRENLRVGIAIEHMYSAIRTVSGVGETNACKLLHLRLPGLLVMTDNAIRFMFKKLCGETFLPYSYAFNFLVFVHLDVNEAIDMLCEEKRLTRKDGMEFLQSAHGMTRSLAKLMDECYYILAHQDFPPEYYASLMRLYKKVTN